MKQKTWNTIGNYEQDNDGCTGKNKNIHQTHHNKGRKDQGKGAELTGRKCVRPV